MFCEAHLYIGDDQGDNKATMSCQLPLGHEGRHRETFLRQGKDVLISWDHDERAKCFHCSRWEHEHNYNWLTDKDPCPKISDAAHNFEDCPLCKKELEAL